LISHAKLHLKGARVARDVSRFESAPYPESIPSGTPRGALVTTKVWLLFGDGITRKSRAVTGSCAATEGSGLRQDQPIKVEEFSQEGIGGLLKLVHGAEEISLGLMKEKDMISQPFGKAHVVSNHNAGKAKLMF
jgi:hypothetical protein